MKIEDKTNEKKMFESLKIGDVFKYDNNIYMKIDPIYPIEPSNIDEIEVYINSFPSNAYNLSSHSYETIYEGDEILAVQATLVIE